MRSERLNAFVAGEKGVPARPKEPIDKPIEEAIKETTKEKVASPKDNILNATRRMRVPAVAGGLKRSEGV